MSRLCITLRTGDTMLFEGATLYFPASAKMHVLSPVRFVLPRQYMPEEGATTPLRKFYYAIQQYYAGPVGERGDALVRAARLAALDLPEQHVGSAERIMELAREEMFYAALKAARALYELDDTAREAAA